MDKSDTNGDMEGNLSVHDPEVAEEAGQLPEEVNSKVTKVNKTSAGVREEVQQDSEEEISRTSYLEEESAEEVSEVIDDRHLNGRAVEVDISEGTQGTEEFVEIVEEFRGQETPDEITQGSEEEEGEGKEVSEREIVDFQDEDVVVENQEVVVSEKKTIKYVEEEVDDLDFSEGPEETQEEPEEESCGSDFVEDKSEREVAAPDDSEEPEDRDEDDDKDQTKEDFDQVDGELETKEPVQIVKTEDVRPTKDLIKTKEKTEDVAQEDPKSGITGLHRRRSSTENFQKLKDRFSNGLKVEENNQKNEEGDVKEHQERGATNMSDKSKRFGGTSEKCTQCNRTVYPMEKMEVAGRLLHKTCFKCCKCNSQLNVGRFSIGGKDMYCMTHYKQAFREKGTYDVFTPDNPIKGKWENKAHE